MKRRTFVKNTSLAGMAFGTFGLTSCNNPTSNQTTSESETDPMSKVFFKFSLAQWSLNQAIREHGMDPYTFAKEAADMGFEGIEYVNQLYEKDYKDVSNVLEAMKSLTAKLKSTSKDAGVKNLLIMIDGEGDLGIKNEKERLIGVENHKKWIDCINELGGHSIRLNVFGEGTAEEQAAASADSLRRLGEYGKDMGINILVENHGHLSSDPDWLVSVMKDVNMDNVGTLPDFGNWCMKRPEGVRWGECLEEYPDYVEGTKKLMPFAKAVSAKSYAFNEKGEQDKVDYFKMIKMIKETGYDGFIGVEYEGGGDERAGILATKELLIKAANAL